MNGKNNTRSVGSFSIKRRSKIRLHDKASILRSKTNKCHCTKRSYFTVGGRKIVTKRCNRTCLSSRNGNRFLLNIFCSSKENRRLETNHKSKTSEQVSKEIAFQNGLSKQGHKSSTTRRLGNFNRSVRCLSAYTNTCEIQKVSPLLDTGKSLPVHLSLFRSNASPEDFYKGSVGNCSTPEIAKCPSSSISRRLVHNKSVKKLASVRQRESAQSTCQTRSYDRVRKISSSSKSKSNLHRGSFSDGQRNCMSNIRKNSENRTSNFSRNSTTNSTQYPSSSGANGVLHRTDTKCSVIHEADTTSFTALLETCNRRTSSKSSSNTTPVRSSKMVEKQRKSVTREAILPRSQLKNSDNRCLQARLRRSPRKSHLSGYMVQRRAKVAHKSPGTESSSFVTPEISASLKGSHCISSIRLLTQRLFNT